MSKLRDVPLNAYAASANPTTPTLRAGDIYYNTGSAELRFYTGSVWTAVGSSSLTYATTADLANVDHAAETAGSATTVARGDHKHDVNSGTPAALSGSSQTAGSATTLALSDHQHGIPANIATTDTAQIFSAQKTLNRNPASGPALTFDRITAATVGTQTVDAASISANAAYWNGSSSTDDTGTINYRHLTVSSKPEWRISDSISLIGITGATATTRWVGGTASVAPTTGTFAAGDWVVAQTGTIYVCTTGGSPGTWTQITPTNMVTTDTTQTIAGGKTFSSEMVMSAIATATSGAPSQNSWDISFLTSYWTSSAQSEDVSLQALRGSATAGDLRLVASRSFEAAGYIKAQGITGAATATRYAGGTASGAPSSGTFVTGDEVIAQNGQIFVCTSGGSPGTWKAVGDIEQQTFSYSGTVATAVGTSRWYLENAYRIESVRASVNTAPTGASLIVDVNKNGTTIYTTQSNRPTIAISGNTATANSPDVTTFAAGDYVTIDVDQIGSTVAGANLTVTVRLRRTS